MERTTSQIPIMKLTSINYARLIAWLSFNKHRITLNRTQLQKILFVCYGIYMAKHDGEHLFPDDKPQAWPFGPVFPRSYNRYNGIIGSELTTEEKNEFLKDTDTLKNIVEITDRLCYYTAKSLTAWSHQPDTPWSKVVIKDGKLCWRTELKDDDIKEYFGSGAWKQGLMK